MTAILAGSPVEAPSSPGAWKASTAHGRRALAASSRPLLPATRSQARSCVGSTGTSPGTASTRPPRSRGSRVRRRSRHARAGPPRRRRLDHHLGGRLPSGLLVDRPRDRGRVRLADSAAGATAHEGLYFVGVNWLTSESLRCSAGSERTPNTSSRRSPGASSPRDRHDAPRPTATPLDRARRRPRRGGAEALLCPNPRPRRLDLAVTRRSRRHELGEQMLRHVRDLVDRAGEDRLVRLRRLRGAAHLAHVLQRSGPTSSSVAGGSKLWSVLMFRHMRVLPTSSERAPTTRGAAP